MRIPYVPNPPPVQSEEEQAIVDRVAARRGDRGLTPLDLALLHSPPVANGWNVFLGAIRTGTSLSPSIRETAICRVAVLNRAWYEWEHHAPILIEAGQMPLAGTNAIFSVPPGTWTTQYAQHKLPFDAKHLAVLEYTDAMTLNVDVPQEVFEKVKGIFSQRELVEITTTIGCYNTVSRFLVALDVGEREGEKGLEEVLKLTGGVEKGAKPAPRSYDINC